MQPQFLDEMLLTNPGEAEELLLLSKNDPRTVKSISSADVNPWISKNGIAPRMIDTAAFLRTLDAATARTILNLDPKTPDDITLSGVVLNVVNPILDFVRYAGTGQPIATTDLDVATQLLMLSELCIALNAKNILLGITPSERNKLIALGGGYRVFDSTLFDWQAAIARKMILDDSIASTKLINDLKNLRGKKLQVLIAQGTTPKSLDELDAVSV